jgi:uncharacterized protein (TIGR00369 family)
MDDTRGVAFTSRAEQYEPLPPQRESMFALFPNFPDRVFFPTLLGLQLEEVRVGYARMRLPYRPELDQPAGVVHGGAIATLIDTVVVPAIGGGYDTFPSMFTTDLHVGFLSAAVGVDLIAEGMVLRRGRSTVFCRAEVFLPDGTLAAVGSPTYQVRTGRTPRGVR